jgi:zinc transport system ATP-binding protein
MQYDARFPATALDIILMGRAGKKRFGPYGKRDKELSHHALDQVGLHGFERRPFPELSGGQQQRILIAQALASEPELLLLDEPTANIDIEGEQVIHELLTGLTKTLTIVSVSHNVNTVLSTVTHVLCVNQGAELNPLSKLNPGTIEKAYGGEISVLHHALNCHIFDSSYTHGTPHFADQNSTETQPI